MPQNINNRSSNSSRYFIQKTYNTRGKKTIRISNNILNMNANGGLTGNELTSQIKSVQFGSNFKEISQSCFVNCASLLSASLNTQCLEIGNAAFKNCTGLKNVNCLKPSTTTIVTQIGNEAFRNTGFETVDIQLSNGGSYGATCGSYAFADCSKLTSVTLERNPYIGDYMFSNCRKLSSFSMVNSHSYVGRNAFENCISLKEIKFPQNFYWLTTEMFKGCTNLSNVTFEEASQLKTIDSDVFSGCSSLTSITLPSSVDSLDYINNYFLRGSNIKRVVLNGFSDEDIASEYEAPHEYTYNTNQIYRGSDNINAIREECVKQNIPLIGILRSADETCPACVKLEKFLHGDTFRQWLENNDKYMVVNAWDDSETCSASGWNCLKQLRYSLVKHRTGTFRADIFYYWKKADGTEVSKDFNGAIFPKASLMYDDFVKYIDETFAGYEKSTEITTTINPSITKFGSSLTSITIVSKTGTEFTCTNEPEIDYEPEVRIDRDTTTDFRFGIWYYNAQQLKAYADQHHIPVFLEFSSATCEPCKDFKQNTFNNQDFQTAIKQKKCLLCRVELEGDESWTTPNTQPYFCVHSWGDPNISIPQTVYYWKKADGTVKKDAYWYNYRTDPTNSTYQTILSRIDTLTAGYTPETGLNLECPTITTIEENKSFKYTNQSGDTRGRFFVQDNKTRRDSIIVSNGITINDKTETSLTTGSATTFPSGYTYMWYYPQTDYMYDRNGLIFKVNSEGKIEYIYSFNNDVEEDNSSRTSDNYNVGTIYEMTENTPSSDFTDIINQTITNNTQINIFKLDSTTASNNIKQIVQGTAFRTYASQKNMLFLIVTDSTGSWSQNTPQSLNQFQTTAQSNQYDPTKVFEPTTVHIIVPSLLVYEPCSSCTTDGTIWEKKKANYDLTGKNLEYIKECIDAESDET